MSLKDNIRKILREGINDKWSTETKALTPKEQAMFRMAEAILKDRHSELVKYYKQREEESGEPTIDGYPNDFSEFILKLKSDFPKYDYFHQIHVLLKQDKFKKTWVIPDKYGIKLLTEYILNFQNEGEQQRVDVVAENDLWDYIKDQYFDCSREFFEHIWEEVLDGRRNYWNEDIKERMWEELQPELEDRMEDEEWQEENGVEFESLSNEEMYFRSYWHYPIQNFGWDEMQLCDYYKEYITEEDIINYIFSDKSNYDTKDGTWGKFNIGDLGKVYIINRNKLFW